MTPALALWVLGLVQGPATAPPALDGEVCAHLASYYDHGIQDSLGPTRERTHRVKQPAYAPQYCSQELAEILFLRCSDAPDVYPTLYRACREECHPGLRVAISPGDGGGDPCLPFLVEGLRRSPCSIPNLESLLRERVLVPARPFLEASRPELDASRLPEAWLALHYDGRLALRRQGWIHRYLEARGLALPEGTPPQVCVVHDEPGALSDAAEAARELPDPARQQAALIALRLQAFYQDLGAPHRALASSLRALILAPPGGRVDGSARAAISEAVCSPAGTDPAARELVDEASALLRAARRRAGLACER